MNKMREQFEKWFSGNLEKNYTSDYKDSDGEAIYLHLPARSAWKAWKASRENLVIKIPITQFDDGCGDTYDGVCLEDMQQALEEQGVKYE